MLRPSHTAFARVDPDATLVLPVLLPEVRADLGLFDDTSFDDLLTEIIASAEEIVSDFLGRPIQSRGVTDYWPAIGQLRLSQSGVDGSSLKVSYHDADEAEQTISGVVLDESAAPPALILPEAEYRLSRRRQNPVSASYSASVFLDARGWSAVRQAIKQVTTQFYYARGRGDVVPDLRHVERILRPHRRIVV